jgi:hypothetical protein
MTENGSMTKSVTGCSMCPGYNRGKGSRVCLKCPEYADILPRYKPGPPISNYPSEIIEGLPVLDINDKLISALRLIDTRQATILMQYTSLNMKQSEIAVYHHIKQPRVKQLINQAKENIKKIIKGGYI